MSRNKRYFLKSKDKIITKMSRDGLVEQNITTGDNKKISNRESDFNLRKDMTANKLGMDSKKTLSQVGTNQRSKMVSRKAIRIWQKQRKSYDNTNKENVFTPSNDMTKTEKTPYLKLQQNVDDEAKVESTVKTPIPETDKIEVPSQSKSKLNHSRTLTLHHLSQKSSKSAYKKVSYQKNKHQQNQVTSHQPSQQTVTENLNFTKDDTTAKTENITPISTDDKSPLQKQKITQKDISPKQNVKISKLEHKADITSKKLDKAKSKLPTKRKLSIERTFDDNTGKGKTRLTFENEVKTQQAHLKGPLLLRPIKFGGNVALSNAHRKMYQVEHENVGTKAAHRTELLAEGVVRSALRHRKTAPYKKVAKLQNKLTKRSVKLEYYRTLEKNPKLKSNPITRMWQKRKIKKRYAKAAREAQKSAQRAKKAASLTGKATNFALNLIKKNPKILIIGILIFVFINVVTSIVGMLAGSGSGGAGAIVVSSYLSSEHDIERVSLTYSEWEMDLMMEIINAEQTHPGYDEYRFNSGDVSHNPFELIAYLTATKHDFTYADVESELRTLFKEQYQLNFTKSIETKYHQQTTGDGEVKLVPYDWHVMTATLTARNFTDIIYSRMNDEQRQHYTLLMESRGQRQVVANPFDFGWLPFITSDYGYRIHPISGKRDLHRGIDIGVPLGTKIVVGFDGVITFSGNNSGYGNIVVVAGKDGLEAKYAHLDSIAVKKGQSVKVGDVIGTVGNTGNSTGPHLHLEVLRSGQYLNPILFVDIGKFDFNTPFAPVHVPPGNAPRPPMSGDTWNVMIAEAEKHLGKPYVFGANGPNAYDCSSFVSAVLPSSGVKDVGRQTAQGLYNLSSPIEGSPQPGDLVFFHSTYSTNRLVTHVGIFAGNDENGRPIMIHAGSPIQYTYIDTPYWQKHFLAHGRISD